MTTLNPKTAQQTMFRNTRPASDRSVVASHKHDFHARQLGPRRLCFLAPNGGYIVGKVDDWQAQTNGLEKPRYVFVSFTRKQFYLPSSVGLAGQDFDHGERQRREWLANVDREFLVRQGEQAAREAGVPAFWLDFECVRLDDEVDQGDGMLEDVYRICDITRAAHSMIIVTGPRVDWSTAQRTPDGDLHTWLKVWGSRLWTVPEALFCPSQHIKVCSPASAPVWMTKRNIAADVWDDAEEMRQLIDHYESSIHLTQLELVSIAFERLQQRDLQERATKPLEERNKNRGEASQVLMGLLRRRPRVDKDESAFEAFARLSLANDSDLLLERLLCMQPRRRNPPWHEMRDAWDANLWDIEPYCQIAGIVDDETVTLDGAFGATVHWEKMSQVAFLKRETAWRTVGRVLLRSAPVMMVVGIILLAIGGASLGQISKTKNLCDNLFPPAGTNNARSIEGAISTDGSLEGTTSTPTFLPVSTYTISGTDLFGDAYTALSTSFSMTYMPAPTSASLPTSASSPELPSSPELSSLLKGNTCDRATDPALAAVLPYLVFGGLLCGFAVLFALLSPRFILAIYCGKLWSTQAWLFGVRGIPDLRSLERDLFGFDCKRLQWSTNGSLLSGHERRSGECHPKPPTRYAQTATHPDPRYPLDSSKETSPLQLYTIIDTFTMTATAFYAEKPPSAAMVCGHEGGMLRVVMCSYDWKARTFVREGVVRMRTLALERMGRVDRFRFALGRREGVGY